MAMRIAMVSPYDPYPAVHDANAFFGGVERMLAEVAKRLADRGHEVTVVCSSADMMPGSEPDNLRVIRVPRHGTVMRVPITNLAAHLPDADVIHVPATYPFTTPKVLHVARRRGIPVVLDFHFEPEPGTPIGHLAASMYRGFGPKAYTLADAVLVRSHGYADHCPSLGGVARRRRHILPNGIDPARFHAGPAPDKDGPILFVGRLVPYKGLEVLLHALAQVPDAPPLWIVGEGPLHAHLEAEAERLGVDVVFHGHVTDEELPEFYHKARFTVLPSVTRQECFGIALIESMACGTPVVASALPGVGDIGAIGGLVARPGDVDALAAALTRALQGEMRRGPDLATEIHERFSWDSVTDRLISVYERVAGSPATYTTVHAHPRGHPVL